MQCFSYMIFSKSCIWTYSNIVLLWIKSAAHDAFLPVGFCVRVYVRARACVLMILLAAVLEIVVYWSCCWLIC